MGFDLLLSSTTTTTINIKEEKLKTMIIKKTGDPISFLLYICFSFFFFPLCTVDDGAFVELLLLLLLLILYRYCFFFI